MYLFQQNQIITYDYGYGSCVNFVAAAHNRYISTYFSFYRIQTNLFNIQLAFYVAMYLFHHNQSKSYTLLIVLPPQPKTISWVHWSCTIAHHKELAENKYSNWFVHLYHNEYLRTTKNRGTNYQLSNISNHCCIIYLLRPIANLSNTCYEQNIGLVHIHTLNYNYYRLLQAIF